MAKSYASTVINTSPDEVWAHVRYFNGLATWHSGLVSESEIEDGKAGDQVGSIRSFTLTDGTHIREQLLAHSDSDRSYTYDFQKTPFDVDNYCATLRVTPLTDGPLQVRGNMEIISGTGRVVSRLESARLCRCGGSATKPFCDGTHAKIGFKS
jgi:hypothetical protein